MLKYKGLHGRLERLIVSEAQVDQQMERLLDQHARVIPVTDRPSRMGDELLLDYAGYMDGEPFEGGSAQGQTLVLGSGAFIPGFEEQLVGKQPGDTAEVRVTFPERYHAAILAGREAVFRCVVREVRRREKHAPDDRFAREVFGLDSIAALRSRLRDSLQAYADRKADEELKARLLDQLLESYEGDIGGKALSHALDMELAALETQLIRQGLNMDAYCRFTGKTREKIREECRPDAVKSLKRQRIIAAVAEAEGIVADEDSVAAAIQQLCRDNNMTLEHLSKYLNEDARQAIVRGVVADKVLDLLRDNADIETVTVQG